jgi:hypothetical protein
MAAGGLGGDFVVEEAIANHLLINKKNNSIQPEVNLIIQRLKNANACTSHFLLAAAGPASGIISRREIKKMFNPLLSSLPGPVRRSWTNPDTLF